MSDWVVERGWVVVGGRWGVEGSGIRCEARPEGGKGLKPSKASVPAGTPCRVYRENVGGDREDGSSWTVAVIDLPITSSLSLGSSRVLEFCVVYRSVQRNPPGGPLHMEVDRASGEYAIVVLLVFRRPKYPGPKVGQLSTASRLR